MKTRQKLLKLLKLGAKSVVPGAVLAANRGGLQTIEQCLGGHLETRDAQYLDNTHNSFFLISAFPIWLQKMLLGQHGKEVHLQHSFMYIVQLIPFSSQVKINFCLFNTDLDLKV